MWHNLFSIHIDLSPLCNYPLIQIVCVSSCENIFVIFYNIADFKTDSIICFRPRITIVITSPRESRGVKDKIVDFTIKNNWIVLIDPIVIKWTEIVS